MKRFVIFALWMALAIALAGCGARETGPATGNDGQEGGQEALYDPSAAGTEVEGGPDEAYLSAGLTYENNMWYYQDKAVSALYDHNGGLYTNDSIDGETVLLEIRRDGSGNITEVAERTEEQFQALIEGMR